MRTKQGKPNKTYCNWPHHRMASNCVKTPNCQTDPFSSQGQKLPIAIMKFVRFVFLCFPILLHFLSLISKFPIVNVMFLSPNLGTLCTLPPCLTFLAELFDEKLNLKPGKSLKIFRATTFLCEQAQTEMRHFCLKRYKTRYTPVKRDRITNPRHGQHPERD